MSLSYSFKGRKVLVTGGGRGIGFTIAKKFYEDGAILYVIDKDQSLLDDVKSTMPNATTICLDLLNWDATRGEIMELGPLDHLVNNAGIGIASSIFDTTESDFDKIFGINVKALVNCSIAFATTIKKTGSEAIPGRTIVNISSMADRLAMKGGGLYCGTKSAVTMFTKSMAVEFAPYKIRVNAICPGFINTDLLKVLDQEILTEMAKTYNPKLLVEEPIETTDVANGVLFLSSPLSAKTTGATLLVESGLTIH